MRSVRSSRRRPGLGFLAGLCLASLPLSTPAQEARYELGRRVRVFEREFPANDPAARKATVAPLGEAVASFFRFRLDLAARAVAEARFALKPEPAPSPARRWAESLEFRPASRWLDAGASDLKVTLSAFYDPGTVAPAGARARLSVHPATSGPSAPAAAVESEWKSLPARLDLPVASVPPGDYRLVGEVVVEGQTLARSEVGISVVADGDARLRAVAKKIAAWPDRPGRNATDSATARALLETLQGLANGSAPETDYPANRLMSELEEMAAAVDAGKPFYGKDRPGEFWLTLPVSEKRTAATRVFVPEAARTGGPLPLVVAMHGAGGSENMFFDAYGAGAVVSLARRRGWLLVAPRAGAPAQEVIAALAAVYPVDRSRIFLVGHSMGAAFAVASAVRTPGAFAGVAALGGGGRVTPSEGLSRLPFFVGVGDHDFALRGAKSLADSLRREGAPVTYREYGDVEHLAVVQVALPDVFAFFEAVNAGPAGAKPAAPAGRVP